MKHQEAEFYDAYLTIIGDSYAEAAQAAHTDLLSSCASQGSVASTSTHTLSTNTPSSALSSICGSSCELNVPSGVILTIDSDLDVAGLEVAGTLLWSDSTQLQDKASLCSGYIGITGTFQMHISSKTSFVYIKNNGLSHPVLGVRSFGAYQMSSEKPEAVFDIKGKEVKRS